MPEEMLQKSVEQYQRLLDHARQLEQLLSKNNPTQVQQHAERLNELQLAATEHDKQLLAQIEPDLQRWQSHPLFQERQQLLEQIINLNNLILPRIRGMMSVTAAELAQLKSGRTAFSGYHPGAGRPKKSTRGVG